MGEAGRFLPTLPPSPGMETARPLLVAMAVGEEAVLCFQQHLPLLGGAPGDGWEQEKQWGFKWKEAA